MELVEFWRARRALVWYLALVVAGGVCTLVFWGNSHVNVDVNDREVMLPRAVPLSVLMSVAMFFTAILASWLGLALNRENATRELSWTRPLPRSGLALRYIAIDAAALAIAFAVTVAMLWFVIGIHLPVVVEPRTPIVVFMASGVIAMWYALVLILSAGVRGHGGAIAGLLWPAALIVLAIGASTRGGFIHDVAVVLDIFNPFAYLGHIGRSAPDGTPVPLLWPLDEGVRAAIVWCFAVAFSAAAVTIWRRREI
jgi:hypothetical protein